MCKYCMLLPYGTIGEMVSENNSIGSIKDGSQIFDVSLNRYVSSSDNVRNNYLELYLACKTDSGEVFNVKSKSIKIKYCPMCGEKL